MNNYNTPVKDVIYKYGVSPFQREGDWICNYCNNLNFAFRKKCNRCKMQTRQENQKSVAYYYSYNSVYYPREEVEALKDISNTRNNIQMTPPRKRAQSSQKFIKNNMSSTLPSVSPLVKKYRSIRQEKQKDRKESIENNQIQTDKINLDFWQNHWQKDFEDFCGQEKEQEVQQTQQDDEYIEQLMNNILC